MMTFKRIKYAVKSALLRLYSRHICPPPTDAKKTPVIINNFNRLTTLKRLIASLTSRGIDNIIILDNASTYPPLLDWYKECGHTVIHLEGNLGFKALWKSRLTKNLYRKGWYIYTDSDVELAKDCPDDIIERMLHVMTVERPSALKTGPSLLINDLPDCFANKTDVIAHEQKFWEHREGDLFRAPIDTTFALYRPLSGLNRSRAAESYRLAPPYALRHLPWYADSANPSEEEVFYRQACTQPTMWTSAAK